MYEQKNPTHPQLLERGGGGGVGLKITGLADGIVQF